MASVTEFTIRCRTETGSFIMRNVHSESTVQELKMYLSKETRLKPECINILCGYPPKALTDGIDSLKLKDVNIRSGETIIVENKSSVGQFGEMVDPTSAEAVLKDVKQERGIAPRVANSQIGAADPEWYGEFFTGIMIRHAVPSNNSCLFTSVSFILSNGDLNPDKSTGLRRGIARIVASNPDKYSDVFLGMPNKVYCTWIQNTDHWGGGIELSILSEHFRIEIVAVDILSLKMHRFGENENYSNRFFLIYDGIHYDPLVLELDNSFRQTIFPVNDDRLVEMALEIAREAKSSRQYTDVANFTVQCTLCGEKLRGEKEAREHAIATDHLNFGEVTK